MARISAEQKREIIKAAEADLYTFACLTNPNRVYGDVHKELFRWWTRPDSKDNQLVLLPRDHQKSHCAAVRAAWEITKNPWTTILYISATSDLAEKQLYAIKNIITSEVYRRYWPEMVSMDENTRELWNVAEISVDHPKRRAEGVRDPTIKAAGLTANVTGLHCNIIILDDIVVPKNAYTEEGRLQVEVMYSQLASVETTGSKQWAVGTRYHPADIYSKMIDMKEEIIGENGEVVDEVPVYEVFEKVVEQDGAFLWPRQVRTDGRAFGFDEKELARKRAKYLDRTQYYAQYYNDPNDPESNRVDSSKFRYYELTHLTCEKGVWYYQDKRLNIFAAADLAYTETATADYTAIVVIGVDSDGYIYVLDMSRFKTFRYEDYYVEIDKLHRKWGFRNIRIETNAGGNLVCEYVKDMVRKQGGHLVVDGKASTKNEGRKLERIAAILEPRYENGTVLHAKCGLTNVLENEIILQRPKHDDLKDALAAAVEISRPPVRKERMNNNVVPINFHPRFGGLIR
jgi:phage terminase large subunit-like protein